MRHVTRVGISMEQAIQELSEDPRARFVKAVKHDGAVTVYYRLEGVDDQQS